MSATDVAAKKQSKIPWTTIVLVVACLVLAAEVVLLVVQNRQLKSTIAEMTQRSAPMAGLDMGDTLSPLLLRDEAGNDQRLEFEPASPDTVLLVYTSTCPACAQTVPVWNDMLPAESLPGVRVVALQLDAADRPTPEPAVNAPRYSLQGVDGGQRFPITRVPATVLLDGKGMVEAIWYGTLSDDSRDSIRARMLDRGA